MKRSTIEITRRDLIKAGTGSLAIIGLPGSLHSATRPAEQPVPAAGASRSIAGSFMFVMHPNLWDMAWSDASLFWEAENWRALVRDMHDLGMDTAIWANCAFWGRPLFPGYEKNVGRPLQMGCPDPLGVVADEADRLGMSVYYGIGLRGRVSQVSDYAGMKKPWPDVWFTWNTALAEALVERYGNRPSFGGLYIAYEMVFQEHEVELYERLVKQHLRPVIGPVKLVASPGNLRGPASDLSAFLKQVERSGFDILAPQDYGGRRHDISQAMELVHDQAKALEKIATPLRNMGVSLWANCETFVLERSPDGRSICMPGPIERIRQQIEVQAPLVEKLITWIYQGVMNRHSDLVNVGHPTTNRLYEDYVAYLKKA